MTVDFQYTLGHAEKSKPMQITKYSRIMDSTGRLVIPAKLRDQLGLQINTAYDFYTHEVDGVTYLCIPCSSADTKIDQAIRLLEEAGMTVTKG